MSLALVNRNQGQLSMGQNGRYIEWGTVKFNASDATGNLPCALRKIESLVLTPAGGAGVAYGPAIPDGGYTVPATGNVLITQTVGAASQVYAYVMIGY